MGYKILFWLCLVLVSTPANATGDGAITVRDGPLVHALRALGVQYQRGGDSPATGFDCSGLVTHVFQRAWGLLLPRTVQEQSGIGKSVRFEELEPGDLVFYNTRNRPYSHVGIYIGDGKFIHAPKPGAQVRIEKVQSSYWRPRFNGARRLDPPSVSF
jgi:cell wall-associated NlpC family hydrolase